MMRLHPQSVNTYPFSVVAIQELALVQILGTVENLTVSFVPIVSALSHATANFNSIGKYACDFAESEFFTQQKNTNFHIMGV
jgi:hypothetical protein